MAKAIYNGFTKKEIKSDVRAMRQSGITFVECFGAVVAFRPAIEGKENSRFYHFAVAVCSLYDRDRKCVGRRIAGTRLEFGEYIAIPAGSREAADDRAWWLLNLATSV